MAKPADENDKAIAATLPKDITSDMKVIVPGPAVYTVKELLESSMVNAFDTTPVVTCNTGHWLLDRMSGGMRNGFVWLLGAETSWGKSGAMIAMADDQISDGKMPLIISWEDTKEVYGDRLMARRSGVSADRLRDRRLTEEEMRQVARVANEAKPVPFFIDARDESVERLSQNLDTILKEHPIDCVYFDYIQEAESDAVFQQERLKYKYIGRMLRSAVKRNGKTGCILTQVTIEDGRQPNKYNVRECKDLANAAEAVVLGWTNTEPVKYPGGGVRFKANSKLMTVAKMKQGRKGTICMDWNDHSACFLRVHRPDNMTDELLYGRETAVSGHDAKSAAAGDMPWQEVL